jgi:hypothetical protein
VQLDHELTKQAFLFQTYYKATTTEELKQQLIDEIMLCNLREVIQYYSI